MKIKVRELEGAQLDYWVARADEVWTWAHELFPTMTLDSTFKGVELFTFEGGRTVCRLVPRNPLRQDYQIFTPSKSWEHGGPIIERKGIGIAPAARVGAKWIAIIPSANLDAIDTIYSDSPLVAAMRAYIA
jgi:hypothetical protein